MTPITAILICWSIAATALGGRPTFNSDPDYLIDTWETEDGLPENSATAIVQSTDGYLWFGTFNGLVRFDGVKFDVLDPGNSPEMPGAEVVSLHLDQSNRLWVGTTRGLAVRDANGHWRKFGTQDGWVGNYARSFAENQNGDLLITTFDGHVIEFANDRLVELPPPGGRAGKGYIAQVDESGHWLVAQQWFVGTWDGRSWEPAAGAINLFDKINGAGAARDGGTWLVAGAELLKLSKGRITRRFTLPKSPVYPWSITEDSKGNVWLATYDNGLTRVTATGEVRRWDITNGLSYDGTRVVFEDHEGNLWVGTSGGGLLRFKPRRFRSYGVENGLRERIVRSVAPTPDGAVWIGTYGKGLCKLNGSVIEQLQLPRTNVQFIYVQCLLNDHRGRLWVGTFGQSAWMADTNGFHVIDAREIGGYDIAALFEDSQGRMWIANQDHVSVIDGDRIQLLPDQPALAGVRCFAEDSSGVLWLSNGQGVFRLENDHASEVLAEGMRPLAEVTCLKSDADGAMWMGTLYHGLQRWREGQIVSLGSDVGLPLKGVHSMIDDQLGCVWITSDRGIFRLRQRDLEAVADGVQSHLNCELFGRDDGLPSLDFPNTVQPSCARDTAGRLWFPTMKGIAMIDPAAFRLNTNRPPVLIESVSYEAPLQSDAGVRETGVQLEAPFPESTVIPAGSRRIEIRYTALSLTAPEKNRFQFKLDGTDADWRDAGTQRTAQFYELAPRRYTFRVRAANNDGVWNEAGTSLAFVVQPFFWQTWWYRVGVIILLVSVGGMAVWCRTRAGHRRQLAELERTRRQEVELAHASRLSIMGELSASMAHELNQPLTAILTNAQAGQRFLAASEPDLAEFNEILKDIAHDTTRARDVIRHLRGLVKKSEREFTRLDVNETIREVVGFLHGDIVARNVQVELKLTENLPVAEGDRIQLQQVIINLLLNAFDAMIGQPVAERRVVISTESDPPTSVRVSVCDDGPGLPPDKLDKIFEPFFTTKHEGMGMGLSVTRSIVESHGGRIWAENVAKRGAVFYFTLKVVEPS